MKENNYYFMNIFELEELENVIDNDVFWEASSSENEEEDENETETGFEIEDFDEETESDVIETCLQLMFDYIDNDPCAISEPTFHETMIDSVLELIYISLDIDASQDAIETIQPILLEKINIACELFYDAFIPPRSYETTFVRFLPNMVVIQKQIETLQNLPQPQQRTKEWYEFRHGLITASNAFKAFGSECSKNSLIYDKCKPMPGDDGTIVVTPQVNVNSPTHLGQRYEPVSVMLYEYLYHTKVGDFGCIQHPYFSFLGASPDGIIIDPASDRYGRMLEIKNPFSREIVGVPKKDYWIQMQLQMETCNLDECDFLETHFIEYETEQDYLDDDVSLYPNGFKGIIVYFTKTDGNPHYEYKPIDMSHENFETWSEHLIDTMGLQWVKNIYWKLNTISCVLVLRNKKWFQDNVGVLKDIWSTIEKERITGCEHRAATKRVKKEQNIIVIKTEESNACLIPLTLTPVP